MCKQLSFLHIKKSSGSNPVYPAPAQVERHYRDPALSGLYSESCSSLDLRCTPRGPGTASLRPWYAAAMLNSVEVGCPPAAVCSSPEGNTLFRQVGHVAFTISHSSTHCRTPKRFCNYRLKKKGKRQREMVNKSSSNDE
jgi:hypothetical protein